MFLIWWWFSNSTSAGSGRVVPLLYGAAETSTLCSNNGTRVAKSSVDCASPCGVLPLPLPLPPNAAVHLPCVCVAGSRTGITVVASHHPEKNVNCRVCGLNYRTKRYRTETEKSVAERSQIRAATRDKRQRDSYMYCIVSYLLEQQRGSKRSPVVDRT